MEEWLWKPLEQKVWKSMGHELLKPTFHEMLMEAGLVSKPVSDPSWSRRDVGLTTLRSRRLPSMSRRTSHTDIAVERAWRAEVVQMRTCCARSP